ncbi:MAG TPA: DNA-processing protein DprA [Bryobacteraceae bacterium]|jgi:DNA processing protein|nr:DNA-processing protein DprA [Bryobacteraceae bacterium]
MEGLMADPVSGSLSGEETLHWLALTLVPGLGTRMAGKLLDRFRTPQALFRASRSELVAAGLGGAVAQSVSSGCSFEDALDQQRKMAEHGAVAIVRNDPRYPALLREIFDPPVLLFARGRLELLQPFHFAVVGTRRPTTYGLAAAERLSGDLARAGLTIVSGMARGIDTTAHKGALAAGGDTVAVLGCGVDVIYPSENRKLANDLCIKGLILSEFAMGSTAFPQNFPIRNRIISGMSVGVLVVEGAQYSGSAITAKLALDQGREVFAIPGNITSQASWGPNLLIKQGAKLVQDWNDVIVELPPEVRRQLIERGRTRLLGSAGASQDGGRASHLEGEVAGSLPEVGRKLLAVLQVDTAIHLDDLLQIVEDTSASEMIAALFELEMLGLVKQLPGKNFVKVW